MTERIVPEDLNLMELATINWTLAQIKGEILSGRPSGQVIDRALDEVLELATHDVSSSMNFPSSPNFE